MEFQTIFFYDATVTCCYATVEFSISGKLPGIARFEGELRMDNKGSFDNFSNE